MRPILLSLLLASLPALGEVSVQDCLDDALLQGHQKTPVQPLPECLDLIKAETNMLSVTSGDSLWKGFGFGHMVYVESLDGSGNLIERSLLAGRETELVSIQKLFIDSTYKRLIVIQLKNETYELMIHDLKFIGNVSPLKVMRSSYFNGVMSIKFNSAEEIEFTNSSGTFTVNADGESRKEFSTSKSLQISPK